MTRINLKYSLLELIVSFLMSLTWRKLFSRDRPALPAKRSRTHIGSPRTASAPPSGVQ